MNILNKPFTLLEIEHLLDEELSDERNNYRIIGDLNLTYEEYCYLELKSKGLQRYESNLTMMEQYKFVLLVSWVFSIRYTDKENLKLDELRNKFQKLPQHTQRQAVKIIAEVFHEYGINTYELNPYTIEGLYAILAIHAGIPEKLHNEIFSILEESLHYKDVNQLEKKLKYELSPRMNFIYEYVDTDTIRKLFRDIRSLFIDCRVKGMGLDELTVKYPFISMSLIRNCFSWCEEAYYYQSQIERKLVQV
jgi:hypothetical protein